MSDVAAAVIYGKVPTTSSMLCFPITSTFQQVLTEALGRAETCVSAELLSEVLPNVDHTLWLRRHPS